MKKNVIITGVSSGIGRATAIILKESGFNVFAGTRDIEKVQDLKKMGIITKHLDLNSDESMNDFVNSIIKDGNNIDVLINNAGYGLYGSVEETPLSEGVKQFDINVFALAKMCQLVIPNMRKNKTGKIINVSSIGGKVHEPLGAWYHASKYAVEGFSDCLRVELIPFGIDVVVVQPGSIKTDWHITANETLFDNSSNGIYKNSLTKKEDEKRSSPDIIGECIKNAILSKKPKTRYVEGKMAKPIIFARKILSDRTMDKLAAKFSSYSLDSKDYV